MVTGGIQRLAAVFLLGVFSGALARAEGPAATPPRLSPLAATLRNVLLDSIPAITEANPLLYSPDRFQKLGIGPAEFQAAVIELFAAHPELRERAEAGARYREQVRLDLDGGAEKRLDELRVDREVPAQVHRSYMAFLLAQRDLGRRPITAQEREARARADTDDHFRRSTIPRNDPWATDFQGRQEIRHEDDEMPGPRGAAEEAFALWRRSSLRRTGDAILANYRAALVTAIEHLALAVRGPDGKVLTPETARKITLRLQKGTNGWEVVAVVGEGAAEKAAKLVFPRFAKDVPYPALESLTPSGREARLGRPPRKPTPKDVRERNTLAALQRLQQLNATLVEMHESVSRARPADPKELLAERLQRSHRDYRGERMDVRSLLFDPARRDFFGSAFIDLLWAGLERSETHWENRQVLANANPGSRSLEHATSGRWFRKGFWTRTLPLVALLTIGSTVGHEMYRDGHFDPLLHAVGNGLETGRRSVSELMGLERRAPPRENGRGDEGEKREGKKQGPAANQNLAEDFQSTPESLRRARREAGQRESGEGEIANGAPPATGARRALAPNRDHGQSAIHQDGEEERPLFRMDSGRHLLSSSPDTLELPVQTDFDDAKLKPITERRPPSEFFVETLVPLQRVGKYVGLPRLRGTDVGSVGLYNERGQRLTLGTDFDIMETPTGMPVAVLREPERHNFFHARTGYSPSDVAERETFLDAKLLEKTQADLEAAGFVHIARALKAEIESAKLEERYVPASRLASIVKRESRYSYHPIGALRRVPDGNPYGHLTGQLDGDGRFCPQCTGARELIDAVLVDYATRSRGLVVDKVTVVRRTGAETDFITPLHAQNTLRHDGERSGQTLDGTPSLKDPRAPEPRNPPRRVAPPAVVENGGAHVPGRPAVGLEVERIPPAVEKEKEKVEEKIEEVRPVARPEEHRPGEQRPEHRLTERDPMRPVEEPLPERPVPSLPPRPVERPVHNPAVAQGNLGPEPPPMRVIHTADAASLTALQAALDVLRSSPTFVELGTHVLRDSLPSTRAFRLARALLAYGQGETDFAALAEVIASIRHTDPLLQVRSPADIPAALRRAAELARLEVSNHAGLVLGGRLRSVPGYGVDGFPDLVFGVFDVAAAQSWTLHRRYVPVEGCQEMAAGFAGN